MQDTLQRWILLEEEVSQRWAELEKKRKEKAQLEALLYEEVKQRQLVNKQVKTTSGKRFVFRERTSFQAITHTLLKDALERFFKTHGAANPTTLFSFILQQRMSKKYFEIEKL